LLEINRYKTKGAIQLAPLSTNAQIGSPEIGLINAVEKAQITAHNTIYLFGRNNIINETIIS